MPRHASYRIIERPDGWFDIAVTLDGGGTHVREGLVSPVDVQTALAMLRDLMVACGAVLVEAEALSLAAE